MKRKVVFWIIIVLVAISGWLATFLVVQHSKEINKNKLSVARSLMDLGEFKEAADTLKSYLIKNPSDFFVRLEYAGILNEISKMDLALEVLFNTIPPDTYSYYQDLINNEFTQVYIKLEKECSDSLELALRQGNYDKAIEYAELQIEYIETEVKYTNLQELTIPYIINLSKIRAKIAFCYWQREFWLLAALTVKQPERHIYYFDNVTIDSSLLIKRSCKELALMLSIEAEKLSYSEDYKTSIFYLQGASKYYSYSEGYEDPDSCMSNLNLFTRYKIARCYYNQDNYYSALKEANKIKKLNPEYQPALIRDLINEARSSAYWHDADNSFQQGSEHFTNKGWRLARENYKKAMGYWEKAGNADENIGVCLYNIAICYYNDGELTDAYKTLLSLQSKYPENNPQTVSELIEEIRLLDLNELRKRLPRAGG